MKRGKIRWDLLVYTTLKLRSTAERNKLKNEAQTQKVKVS